MKSTSSNGALTKESVPQGLKFFLLISSIACLLVFFLLIHHAKQDSYTKETLSLAGSIENGAQLFRMNCVGCHGISAQGLVGPELSKVTEEINDSQIIRQIVNGLTPPMPSFEMDSQSMADLLAYLHSLDNSQ